MNIERLLVLEPHPDDFILMCGGLARRLANEGKPVYVVTFTHSGATVLDAGQHKLQRSRESEAADRILGTAGREILDHEVRESWNNTGAMYNELMGKIRGVAPDTIITMHYDNVHPDHMWIAQFVKAMTYQAGEPIRPDLGNPVRPRVLLGENPRSQLSSPTVYVDITGTFEAKDQALGAQTSQHAILGPRIFHDARALAAYRAIGMPVEVKYCEAFQEVPVHYKEMVR